MSEDRTIESRSHDRCGAEEGGLLDQIITETRIGRDDEQREQSRQQIATLVEEVMKRHGHSLQRPRGDDQRAGSRTSMR